MKRENFIDIVGKPMRDGSMSVKPGEREFFGQGEMV